MCIRDSNGIKNTRCFYCTIPEVQTAEAILRAFIMDPVKAPVPPGEPVPEAAPAESVARNGKRKKQPSAK